MQRVEFLEERPGLVPTFDRILGVLVAKQIRQPLQERTSRSGVRRPRIDESVGIGLAPREQFGGRRRYLLHLVGVVLEQRPRRREHDRQRLILRQVLHFARGGKVVVEHVRKLRRLVRQDAHPAAAARCRPTGYRCRRARGRCRCGRRPASPSACPASSGAGALVKLILATTLGYFVWYASIASCSNASAPPTSTTLIVTGLAGIGEGCASHRRPRIATATAATSRRKRPRSCTATNVRSCADPALLNHSSTAASLSCCPGRLDPASRAIP